MKLGNKSLSKDCLWAEKLIMASKVEIRLANQQQKLDRVIVRDSFHQNLQKDFSIMPQGR